MHRFITCLAFCLSAAGAQAQPTVALDLVDATGAVRSVGTVALAESPHGLVFTPVLHGLPPGMHGFHVHEKGSCAPSAQGVPAGAAGGCNRFHPSRDMGS